MKQKKKLLIIILIVLVAVGAALGAAVGYRQKQKASGKDDGDSAEKLVRHEEQVNVSEAYACDLGVYGEDNKKLWVYFDSSEGTFVNQIGEDPVAQGTFSVDGNEIVTTVKDDDGNELAVIRYLLDGEYLLIEDGVYNGKIPDGNTFEAVVEKTDSTGMVIRYTFREDGTYTCLEIPEGAKEEDGTVLEGTYSRDGSVVSRTLSGNEMIPFYVYEGHLFVSYYVEADV